MVLIGAVFLLGTTEQFLTLAGCGLPPRRKLAGHALAAALALLLTLLLASLRGRLGLTGDVLAFLLAVIVVGLAGGFIPAVLEAVVGALLLHSFATAQDGGAGRVAAGQGVGDRVAGQHRRPLRQSPENARGS
jgi:Domain of unknown function (DUF4118)